MLAGKTIEQFNYEILRQNELKEDYLIDTRDLVMDADENGAVLTLYNRNNGSNTLLGINDIAHAQIATNLGIPRAYYERMQNENPALLVENVNTWFASDPKERMIRSLDNTARAFLSKKYRRIDNYDIYNAVLPMLDEYHVKFESMEITDTRMYIKVVNERLTKEVKPGDYVQSGVIISNSEVGMGTVTIQPLLYRLVCTNGMVVNAATGRTSRRHIGKGNLADENLVLYADDTLLADDHALLLKMRDTIKASLDEVHFTNLIDQMKTAAEVPITSDDIPGMVKLAAPTFGLKLNEAEAVTNHLIRGGDLSLYGLANAVTRFAQDVKSYDRSTELEAIGYDIMTMPESTWRRINVAA